MIALATWDKLVQATVPSAQHTIDFRFMESASSVSGILAGNLPFGCTRGRIEEEEKDMKELVLPEDGRWGLLALNLSKVSRALSQQKPCKCTNKLF